MRLGEEVLLLGGAARFERAAASLHRCIALCVLRCTAKACACAASSCQGWRQT